ncbi:MAG: hypothetical protein QF473_27160, partial [Planctomycetota bacterium]|nr:hypothetical protein [Planctomycetota bacterium]
AFESLVQWHAKAGNRPMGEHFLRKALDNCDPSWLAGCMGRKLARFNKPVARRFFQHALDLADQSGRDANQRISITTHVALDSRIAGIDLGLPSMFDCFRRFTMATSDSPVCDMEARWVLFEDLIRYFPDIALRIYPCLRTEQQRNALFSAVIENLRYRGDLLSQKNANPLTNFAHKRPAGYHRAKSLAICARVNADPPPNPSA